MLWTGFLLAAVLAAVDGTQGGQAAQRDFNVAEFYLRTGHAESATFYYQLVCRRYPGTDVAERARGRLTELDK
jgi:outer membrane protein assembly factor BamD (BamD/ComL family)